MRKALAWTLLTLSIVIGAAACKENPKATEACKDKASGDDCSKCCTENGANGYKYMGDGCKCLGG